MSTEVKNDSIKTDSLKKVESEKIQSKIDSSSVKYDEVIKILKNFKKDK